MTEPPAYAPTLNPTFSGGVGLPGGGSTLRQPVNGSAAMNGQAIRGLSGDKVAYAFSSCFSGGFVGDAGGNPTFAWGANDFCVTGKTAGDVDGLRNLTARETEVHLYTPTASLGAVKALQLDCKIEAPAAGATVTSMFGLYVTPLASDAPNTTVTNAYGVYIEAPTTGANRFGLYVNGATNMVGPLTVNGASAFSGASFTVSTSARFAGSVPTAQATAAGAYVGKVGGANYGLQLNNGAAGMSVDLDDTGTLRFVRSGVKVLATLAADGTLTAPQLRLTKPTPTLDPATDAATTQALVNDLRAKLVTLGVVS